MRGPDEFSPDEQTFLFRLGRWCFEHRGKTLGAWVAALVVLFAAAGIIGSGFNATNEIPSSESQRGLDTIDEFFGGVGSGHTGSIVFVADQGVDDAEVRATMEQFFAQANAIDDVTVSSPYAGPGSGGISEDGIIAYAAVDFASDITDEESPLIADDIKELEPTIDGVRIEYGGYAMAVFEPPESELIGVAFAVIVLIIAFGSVLAMGLPIGIAAFGVSGGVAAIVLLSNFTEGPSFVTTMAVMIGLGAGIDYALFVVTRFRENLHAGLEPGLATAAALDTAGRAVLFAGLTVVISLLGLIAIGLPFVTAIGVAMATSVLCTMIASVTLLPAFLGFAQRRVEVTRWRGLIAAGFIALGLAAVGLKLDPIFFAIPMLLGVLVLIAGFAYKPLKRELKRRPPKPIAETFAYRFSRFVQGRPWTVAVLTTMVLLFISIPLLGLRLGFSDEGNWAEDTTTRQAYDLLADGFGPGFNGPLLITAVPLAENGSSDLETLTNSLVANDGVDQLFGPIPDDPDAPSAFLYRIIPTSSPQDEATKALIEELRDEVIPAAASESSLEVSVTGVVAAGRDFTAYLSGRMPVFFGAVLTLSFLLLMVVFRSLLIPLKAVVMNLLSIGAAYGVIVAMFQWGWAGGITGIEPAPIEPWMPMMLFAIVFGLSMDYEVFLLSRVKEEYDRSGDSSESVANGLATTARVISAAAAIMVVVFGSFLLEDDRVLQLFGTGLAAAIFMDATLVRMLLVPATMELLGSRNWWMPAWLDRVLPRVSVEGSRQHS